MLKKLLIGFGLCGLLFGFAVVYGIQYFKPNEDAVLDYIIDHPETTAIKLVRNDELIGAHNPDKMMPLASTMKIIIAIEYAIQVSEGKLNSELMVHLDELEKYYVPSTDGGAHPSWLKSVDNKIIEGRVSIREIAKGMIRYSSNANTEWLTEKLGIDNVNSRLDSLGVTNHSEIYYLASSLFVGKELFPTLKGEELAAKLRAVSESDYIAATHRIHAKLKSDSTYRHDVGELGMNVQRVWSDRLQSSTVSEYVDIMKKINSRAYFDGTTHDYLNDVMESVMNNPANQSWLAHSGMKGGSTAFVLTKALYATDKKGNTTELAYFINDLSLIQNQRLQRSTNQFELKLLTDEEFFAKIKKTRAGSVLENHD